MLIGHKYRFYPNSEQEDLLRQTFGAARWVFNRGLDARKHAWKLKTEGKASKGIGYRQTSAMLPGWKSQNPWLKEPSSVCLQQALRNLDTAYKNFFAGRAKFPQYRKRHDHQSLAFTKSAFTIKDGQVTLAKMSSPLDIRWSRELPSDPSSVTVSLDKSGRWHISFQVEHEPKQLVGGHGKIAFDLGLGTLITTWDGEKSTKVENPHHLKKRAKKLARAQRQLSKKKKKSKNRNKARLKVARQHARVADARKDHLHKLTTRLIRENQTICLEDLNIKGLAKTKMAKSIHDVAWGELVRQLTYKAEWYGRELIFRDRYFPSTQMCSAPGCGALTGPKGLEGLKVRNWVCSACDAEHDRDVCAAQNIYTGGTPEIYACRGDVRPVISREIGAISDETGMRVARPVVGILSLQGE